MVSLEESDPPTAGRFSLCQKLWISKNIPTWCLCDFVVKKAIGKKAGKNGKIAFSLLVR